MERACNCTHSPNFGRVSATRDRVGSAPMRPVDGRRSREREIHRSARGRRGRKASRSVTRMTTPGGSGWRTSPSARSGSRTLPAASIVAKPRVRFVTVQTSSTRRRISMRSSESSSALWVMMPHPLPSFDAHAATGDSPSKAWPRGKDSAWKSNSHCGISRTASPFPRHSAASKQVRTSQREGTWKFTVRVLRRFVMRRAARSLKSKATSWIGMPLATTSARWIRNPL